MMKLPWRRLGYMLLPATVLGFFCVISPIQAKPKVTCEIEEVSKHDMLVTFSWKVSIQSDKTWEGCDLKISFRDGRGEEIYVVKETIALKIGQNAFSGAEICAAATWKRVAKYVTTLDCLF